MPHARVAGLALAALLLAPLLTGCGEETEPPLEAPELGACRMLDPEDVSRPSNATATVDCAEEHNAQTYAVGDLPAQLHDAAYDSEELGAWAYRTCTRAFAKFLGADESVVMRTMLTWAWFRPSEDAWDEGARWYRCDAVGGGEHSEELHPLPEDARGLLAGRPDDRWMVCSTGATLAAGTKVPCTEPHEWRAVSTVRLGDPDDPYPGDRVVEVKSRDFCSDQVGAVLGYPVDYDFAFTWFQEAEWEAGNRRSVCWAKTPD